MTAVRKDGPRPAVIGTCTLNSRPEADAEEMLADRLAMLDSIAREAERQGWDLDVALVPEFAMPPGTERAWDPAEEIDGPTLAAYAEKARQYHTHVAAPVYLRRGDRTYNSVVMLGRDGEPVGEYHKVFPVMMTDGSLERGVTPGDSFPVFDLDIGRVAVQICWDGWFPEGWRALGKQEAELVLYPTSPLGMVALRAHAWEHGYYIAGSTMRPPAAVIDPTGAVLAMTTEAPQPLVVRVDLDYRVLNTNCLWEWPASKFDEYAGRIKFEWHEDEYVHLVTSLDPALPVRRFLEQEGLLTGRQRCARNLQLLDEARPGKLP
jgi:predicted amidohydrolase